ncbi:hypothetical protein FSP39_013481 [Pinctada imbricata]|uniref:Uncharacterized protein n=1 Tax=Pinctada imbricata TaxID=66713 RepID=A0AA88YGC2_PINIB|nr:hypothetical protein FSP39_013481 [Pinctada imbricata]
MSARTSAALEIRKLRKKLRQIENLERKDRDLTDEELIKITKKQTLREKLLELLATSGENDDEFTESTKSDLSSKQSYEYSYEEPVPKVDISNIEVTVVTNADEEEDDIVNVDIDEDDVDIHVAVTTQEEVTISNDASQGETTEKNLSNSSDTIRFDVSPREPLHQANTQPSTKKEKVQKATKKNTKETKVSEKAVDKDRNLSNPWRTKVFSVFELEGHNDLVTAADIRKTTLVTASRDTTIRTWDIVKRQEIRSYGGHTGTVTCVVLLSEDDSKSIGKFLETEAEGSLIISGSTDCSVKIWSAETGEILRSTYTYNPVTRLVYHPVAQVVLTASDGGKIDVWSVESGENVQSLRAFDDCVTGLQVSNKLVYASSSEGTIKVFETRESELVCIFESENIQAERGGILTERHIRGFYANDELIYYGDDGINIKVLNWKTGKVRKLPNHCEDFGVTDCIVRHNQCLLSSAYSLDSGLGYVNIREFIGEKYLTSLNDTDTERVISLCCTMAPDGALIVVTAGMQLKVWTEVNNNQRHKDYYHVKANYNVKLNIQALDSDVESDFESSQSDDENDSFNQSDKRRESGSSNTQKGWTSWCNII